MLRHGYIIYPLNFHLSCKRTLKYVRAIGHSHRLYTDTKKQCDEVVTNCSVWWLKMGH